ncbi:MAG: hypothetical protein COB24_08965 [Hyphomicrobiales bacterium]|nr:MAG: hypothetical protein COB24_08965 [Hyphomicrobiales bacterium]
MLQIICIMLLVPVVIYGLASWVIVVAYIADFKNITKADCDKYSPRAIGCSMLFVPLIFGAL